MTDWRTTTIGEIASVVGGGTPSTARPEYWDGDIAWLTPGDLAGREGSTVISTSRSVTDAGLAQSSAKMLPRGTVLLTSRATVGATAIAGIPMCTNQGFQSLIPGPDVLPRFLMYWVQANTEEFQSRASGSTFPEISGKKIKAIPITLPTLPEQRRIADLVGRVDALIQALANEASALWRVYFDMANGIWDLDAPHVALESVMALDLDRVAVEGDQRYRIAGLLNGGQGFIDKGSISGAETGYATLNRIREDQVVMRKLTAWEGPISVASSAFDGAYASGEFPTFTLTEQQVPDFFRHFCRTSRLRDAMRSRVTGSVQRRKRLNPEQLLAISAPIPDQSIQVEMARRLSKVESASRALDAEGIALSEFRSRLLTEILNHSTPVPESYDVLIGNLETAT